MKDQYFGDERDYFKYDLMLDLMGWLGIPRFTNIVMLTPNDMSGQGGQTDYEPGNRRRTLYDFLRKEANGLKRDRRVVRLREYFRENCPGIEYLPYRDDSSREGSYLTGSTRGSYFNGIQSSDLQRAVILVDPDTGLCPPSRLQKRDNSKWVLPSEMLELKQMMASSSVLVMIQFRGRYTWPDRLDYIRGKLGELDAIHNGNDPGFICLTKDPDMRSRLRECLYKYEGKVPELKVFST